MEHTNYAITRTRPAETFSMVSILSVVAAIASFYAGAGFGLLLALLAILFGVLGLVFAISPARRGGFLSVISIFAGVIGIVAAIAKLAGNVLG